MLSVLASVLLVVAIVLGAIYLLRPPASSHANGAMSASTATSAGASRGTSAGTTGSGSAGNSGSATGKQHADAQGQISVEDVLGDLTLSDANVILVQNFISTMYTDGIDGLSTKDLAQFAPLVDEARKLFGDSLDELDLAGVNLDDVDLDGITFDLLEDPQVTKLGNNGVQVVVCCSPRVDGAGDVTLEDLWSIVFSQTGGIEGATVQRS